MRCLKNFQNFQWNFIHSAIESPPINTIKFSNISKRTLSKLPKWSFYPPKLSSFWAFYAFCPCSVKECNWLSALDGWYKFGTANQSVVKKPRKLFLKFENVKCRTKKQSFCEEPDSRGSLESCIPKYDWVLTIFVCNFF